MSIIREFDKNRVEFNRQWSEFPNAAVISPRNIARIFFLRGVEHGEQKVWQPIETLPECDRLVQVVDNREDPERDDHTAVLKASRVEMDLWTHWKYYNPPEPALELEPWEVAWKKLAGSPRALSCDVGHTRVCREAFKDVFTAIHK